MSNLYVFEGINGSGKTTVLQAVAERLRARRGDASVVTLCNPTSGPVGLEIRRFVAEQREKGFPIFFSKSEETMNFARRLAVLFAADRHQQQDEILAHIRAGKVVLCDRYSLSTLVYQCAMVGEVHFDGELAKLIRNLHEGLLTPRTTFIIDVPVDVARGRLLARGERNDDRMMALIEPAARSMYLDYERLADDGDGPIDVGCVEAVDGDRPIEDVVDDIAATF
jgi:dTMP kinase